MINLKKVNRGKDFENCIKTCFEQVPNVSVDRLPDPMGGYVGVRNICDFSVFNAPDTFYIECKCFYDNTLNYKSQISENQWAGLEEKSKIKRCVAGLCIWFIDYDLTVFVKIQDLLHHRDVDKAKSLNISDIVSEKCVPHFIVDGVKKRIMFNYFGEDFLRKLHNVSNELWGEYDGK